MNLRKSQQRARQRRNNHNLLRAITKRCQNMPKEGELRMLGETQGWDLYMRMVQPSHMTKSAVYTTLFGE